MKQLSFLGLLLACLPLAAVAQVPHEFELVYRFTFNGYDVGTVTDRFQRADSTHYQLTSVAKPDPSLAFLLPTLTLTSRGRFTGSQLLPLFYHQARSNAPEKAVVAELDWTRGTLTHQSKGRSEQAALPPGTQDALTQIYVFAMMEALPGQFEMPVTNGRRLLTYRYEKRPGPPVTTPQGTFETVEYRRIVDPGENQISVWIAPALHYLPVRIRVQEDSGIFEQQLIKLDYRAA